MGKYEHKNEDEAKDQQILRGRRFFDVCLYHRVRRLSKSIGFSVFGRQSFFDRIQMKKKIIMAEKSSFTFVPSYAVRLIQKGAANQGKIPAGPESRRSALVARNQRTGTGDRTDDG